MFMNGKRLLSTVLLLFLVNALCLPLWTEYSYGSFVRTLFIKEAGLDLAYSGVITADEPFHYQIAPEPSHYTWLYKDNVHLLSQTLKARWEWQKVSVRLKALRDGTITTLFRGAHVRDDYGRYFSIPTDWQNVKINGYVIFKEAKTLSFQKTFAKHIPVKKDDVIQVEGEFRRHHFTVYDFTRLTMGKVWFLITGNLLFFFLTYRLLSYMRGGGIRKSDAFLLTIFFSMLFIPMIGTSNALKSVRENRVLAGKPELKDLFKEKSDYGRRYENYFNDHFGGRVSLLKLHDDLRNKLSCIIRANGAIYFKENGWEFLTPLVPNMEYNPTTIQSIVSNLSQLNQFCRQNGIRLYVLEVPRKENVYKEFLINKYGFDEKALTNVLQAQETIRNEVRKHHIPYVYLYKALHDAAKRDFVFFKCSQHWTDWGAFVGYRVLMKEVHRDFPDMPIASLNDYKKSQNWLQRDTYWRAYALPGHFYKFFNDRDLALLSERSFYNYYDYKNDDKIVVNVSKFTKNFIYPDGKYKVMLIGTSQNENFLQFLPYSATQTRYIRLNMAPIKAADQFKILKLYKKDILAFKPDILVLSIHSDNLPELRNLCSTK